VCAAISCSWGCATAVNIGPSSLCPFKIKSATELVNTHDSKQDSPNLAAELCESNNRVFAAIASPVEIAPAPKVGI